MSCVNPSFPKSNALEKSPRNSNDNGEGYIKSFQTL